MSSDGLVEGLRAKGIHCRIASIDVLPRLKEDIESLRLNGSIDPVVYETNLRHFHYQVPENMPDARTIIVAAMPQPIMRIHFEWHGKDFAVVVPPTYSYGGDVNESMRRAALDLLGNADARLERATLPLKTLAARMGLVRYGRNNITYLPEVGSFHRLAAFFCDQDLIVDEWREREMLSACKNCRKCLHACPGQVITEERFLVHIERCLTYFNEKPNDHAFPAQVDSSWHNAIVGCMRCQEVCPYDQKIRSWTVEGERFSESETRYLLEGDFSGESATEMGKKLERYGLELALFPRNLKVLLDARR
jgi:epoxyqueuosine reductase